MSMMIILLRAGCALCLWSIVGSIPMLSQSINPARTILFDGSTVIPRFSPTLPARLAFLKSGYTLVPEYRDLSRTYIYDVATMTPIDSLEEGTSMLGFSADGRKLIYEKTATNSTFYNFWLYGVRTVRGFDSLVGMATLGTRNTVNRIITSPDQRWLYVSGSYGIRIADMSQHDPRFWDTLGISYTETEKAMGLAWDMDLSSDGSRIATSDALLGATAWNTETREQIWQEPADSAFGYSIHYARDDSRLLVALRYRESGRSFIEERDAETGALLHAIEVSAYSQTPPVGGVTKALYVDGDRLIAAVCTDTTLRLWDATTYELVDEIRNHRNEFFADASPDGRYLATAGWDSLLHIYEFAPSSVVDGVVAGEMSIGLLAPQPNPSSDRVEIPFTLAAAVSVELSLVDLHGRTVIAPTSRRYGGGRQSEYLDVYGLPNGIYFVVLSAGGEKRMTTLQVVR